MMQTGKLHSCKNLQYVILFWIFSLLSAPAFAVKLTVSGSVPRGTAVTSFDLVVTISDVDAAHSTTMSGEKDLAKDRLRVVLPAISQTALPWEGTTTTDAAVDDFFISKTSDPVVSSNSNNLYDITYYVTVNALNDATFNTYYENKKLKVTVRYYHSDNANTPVAQTDTPQEISVSVKVVKSAPADFQAAASDRSLVTTFATTTSVTMSDDQSGTASSVVVVAIPQDASITDLPAMEFIADENATGDTEAPSGSCTYDPNFTDGATRACFKNDQYYL